MQKRPWGYTLSALNNIVVLAFSGSWLYFLYPYCTQPFRAALHFKRYLVSFLYLFAKVIGVYKYVLPGLHISYEAITLSLVEKADSSFAGNILRLWPGNVQRYISCVDLHLFIRVGRC